MIFPKISNGNEIASIIFSELAIATDFGVNSPRMICIAVINAKPTASEIVCPIVSSSPKYVVIGRINFATNGSPTQPNPNEASVIPSCVTDSEKSSVSVSCFAYLARLLPSRIIVSILDGRIFTQQNSAATKKPFIAIKNKTRNVFKNIEAASKNITSKS